MNTHNNTNNYAQVPTFQQNKMAWENAISSYTGSDPLEIWFRYICWYEQNTAMDPDNEYEAALGKCLSMYEYNESFKQDIRMVKLWMKYINLKPNPLNLFQVLYQRGVGTQCSVFYVGWAHYFMMANAFKQAESVYNLGFRAKAQPYDELQAAYSKFRMTMSQKIYYEDQGEAQKRSASQMNDGKSPMQMQQQQIQPQIHQQPQVQQQIHQQPQAQLQIQQQQQPVQQQQQQQIHQQSQYLQQQQIQQQPPQQPQYQQQSHLTSEHHQSSIEPQQQYHQSQGAAVSVIKRPRMETTTNHVNAGNIRTQTYADSPPPSVAVRPTAVSVVRSVSNNNQIGSSQLGGRAAPAQQMAGAAAVASAPVRSVSPAVHHSNAIPATASSTGASYPTNHLGNLASSSAAAMPEQAFKYQTTSNRYYNNNNNHTNSEQSNLNNVISSSLNFVYCDQTMPYEEQSADGQEDLSINIPSNFVRYSKSNHETWSGALFLDEPFEENKCCQYPKHFVYPGDGCEYSLEEIRARHFTAKIEMCKEINRQREMERARERAIREQERQRIEQERQRLAAIEQAEQERIRQIELERQRRAEQERQRLEQLEQQRQEQERLRQEQEQQAEYERMRQVEKEQARAAEFQRYRAAELERKRSESEQRIQAEKERDEQIRVQNLYRTNGYTTTTTTTTVLNSNSDDIEEQIEASTIRFSTDTNGLSKPKTITIKFRKEKPSSAAVPSTAELSKVPSPSPNSSKAKKERKHKSAKKHQNTNGTSSSQSSNNNYDNKQYQNNHHHHQTNNIDDANLLLSIANIHSSKSSDEKYSTALDDSYSNSEFTATTASSSTENSNSNFNFSASSTPIRGGGGGGAGIGGHAPNYLSESYSKPSTPQNFKILKNRHSDISNLNDDSMNSSMSLTSEQNSFFVSEHDEELQKKRREKALATIEAHLLKKSIDPFSSELCKAFLTKIGFPSREHNSFYRLVNNVIPKLCNTKVAMLANVPYQIEREVGRGSYGNVYKAINGNTGAIVALKFQKPANNWELYICTEVRKKITDPDILQGFMDISSAIVAPNASIFVTEFSQYGSLLDINNRIRQNTTKVMHESLVMHFSSQILMIVHHLHSCNIIHADIKPDNFLLMKIPTIDSHVPTLRLIDFGCAIDMNFFEPNAQFLKRIETDGFTCTEMQDGRAWSYQTDIFCIAATIHVMLFGEYMQLVKKFGQWDIKTKLPRYLKKHIWSDLFTNFLNIKDIDYLPNLLDMKSKIDDELYNMESELQSQIRTLSNILHRR